MTLDPILAYARDLEVAAAEHPAHARRLLAEAADVWLCLGRTDRCGELLVRLVLLGHRRRRRPSPALQRSTCLRARSKA